MTPRGALPIIAEPGCTHEGDYQTLVRLLDTAAACGANVFKPQWVSDPVQMCERRHIGPDHPKRAYYQRAYNWLAFPVSWHWELAAKAHERGMSYACTVFLPDDAISLAPFVDRFKVSSFEHDDVALLKAVSASGKPWTVSLGMTADEDMPLLHPLTKTASRLLCTTAYPAPLDALQLRAMREHHLHGLSDHSRHVLTGAVAVGAGGQIIETHYRLDDCDPNNPDYPVAFTPAEFTQYVKHIRDAELMMGDGVKRVQPCEEWALPYRVG